MNIIEEMLTTRNYSNRRGFFTLKGLQNDQQTEAEKT